MFIILEYKNFSDCKLIFFKKKKIVIFSISYKCLNLYRFIINVFNFMYGWVFLKNFFFYCASLVHDVKRIAILKLFFQALKH